MIGFDKRTIEPGDGLPAGGLDIDPAAGVTAGWVTLLTWTPDEAVALHLLGPAWLYGHVGADLGDPAAKGDARRPTFPATVMTQWLRASGDGLTARHGYAIGTTVKWADGASDPEYLTLDDFPLAFQVWQQGGVFIVRKATAVIDAPDSRIAARIAP